MHLWKSFVWNAGGLGEIGTFVKQARLGGADVPGSATVRFGVSRRLRSLGPPAYGLLHSRAPAHPEHRPPAPGSEDSRPIRPGGGPQCTVLA